MFASCMAKLPTNFSTYQQSPDVSPAASDEEISAPKVTKTVGHPYMMGKVRMRRKPQQEELENNDEDSNIEMMSLKIKLENAKTELNRRTVLFSNHYNDMVGKWQNEKTKREVAETVAVEKARDNVVLQRTQISLKIRAKQSTEGVIDSTQPEGEDKRETLIEGDVVNLTEQNEKQNLELQDLKDTVKLLEDQIADYKQENADQSLDIQEMAAKLIEMENELKQSKSYMQSAQHQYKNLAGRLQDEKGKREIAENVAVNKARELEVQKRTSVMVMSSLTQSFNPDNFNVAGPSIEALDYATKISTLEAEVEDLKESKVTLENALTKFEQECHEKDIEIKQLRERLFIGSFSRSPLGDSLALSQSVATNRPSYGEYDDRMSRLSSDALTPLLLQSTSTGTGTETGSGLTGGTLNRPKQKNVGGLQSKEQLQQELKSKEAMINIMKLKLEKMKFEGSKEDPELEVERKELEDQVGGLDRKLSSMNSDDKKSETEVDELREKLENVEKKAADFEEKTRYYQELLNKMNRSSDYQPSPRTSPTPDSSSPVNIPPPPPNLPPPPPPPLPEGLFGPATPHLVIAALSQKSSRALKGDNRGEAMSELMTMLSSGKVHLKRAKNKVPVSREEQPPVLQLPRAMLRRQITAPDDSTHLTSSFEGINPYYSVKPTANETIDERLRLSRQNKNSSEQGRSSELFKKLNQRFKSSESQSDEIDSVQVLNIDSNPLPSVNTYQPKPVKRKITPAPTHSPVRSPILTRKNEEIESIPEEKEVEQQSPPPLPEKKSKQTSSPLVSPQKTKTDSPLIKQSSADNPNLPAIRTKPSVRCPILPPSNREFVPITVKPDLKREKSGSNPIPISTKPTNVMGLFKQEKSTSIENAKTPRATADIEAENNNNSDTDKVTQNRTKLKIPQVFDKK